MFVTAVCVLFLVQLLSYYATENNVYISEMLQMQSADLLRSNQSTYNSNYLTQE